MDYDADRIPFEQLVRTYWKYVQPTQTDGQFSEKGPQYRSAIWVADGKEKSFVQDCIVRFPSQQDANSSHAVSGVVRHCAPLTRPPCPPFPCRNGICAEQNKLDRSGIFGKAPIVTQVLDAPPVDFEPGPEDRRQVLRTAPKSLQKLAKSRDAYFKDHWGFVQFCKVRSLTAGVAADSGGADMGDQT